MKEKTPQQWLQEGVPCEVCYTSGLSPEDDGYVEMPAEVWMDGKFMCDDCTNMVDSLRVGDDGSLPAVWETKVSTIDCVVYATSDSRHVCVVRIFGHYNATWCDADGNMEHALRWAVDDGTSVTDALAKMGYRLVDAVLG